MQKGDIVRIATEWLGENENPNRIYIVREAYDNGRVDISAVDCDYLIVPVETVSDYMLRKIGSVAE